MKRRKFILLLGSTSAGALTVVSGAFSSTAAERGVNVDVVPDEDAYVGYEIQGDGDSDPPEIVVTAGESEELVRITNHFPEDTEIEIVPEDTEIETVEASAPELSIEHDKDSFRPGETVSIDGTCNSEGTTTVALTVTVEAVEDGGVSARLFGDTETRRFKIRCEESASDEDPDVPEFAGGGNAFLGPEGVVVEVLALYGEPKGDTRIEPSSGEAFTWNTDEHDQFNSAKPDDDFDPSNKLLALYFTDLDRVYYNPRHIEDENEIDFPDDWPQQVDRGAQRGGGGNNEVSSGPD